MTLVVEDGTGLANADSYGALAACAAYHLSRGNAAWASASYADADREAALRRGTFYIDPKYRARFPGYQTLGRAQALEWPRQGAYVIIPDNGRSDAFFYVSQRDYYFLNGLYYIQPNFVPQEVVTATYEAALRELVSPGVLTPDQTREDLVQYFQVGPVQFDYGPNAPQDTIFQKIDYVLRSLLMPSNQFSGKVSR